ncbi:hypothetical protein BN1723_002186 [Verticillium longisporum]|uniref:Uncharacterized protein n=1 Tax=Verticillium longisporum TaxID=100787 RepID=A0A0G4L011_VERLO|nr:hypothetical protein BN1723_002186 [Verticillium longisporum]
MFEPEQQKQQFGENLEKYLAYHKGIEDELNRRQNFFMKGSPEQAVARRFLRRMVSTALAEKPELAERPIPSFDLDAEGKSCTNGLDT